MNVPLPKGNFPHFVVCVACVLLIGCAGDSHLHAIETAEGTEVLDGDTRILFFQEAPKSLDGKYERAGYIHPLYDLDGNIISEDFPEDHPHHHGIYSAWHQILINGKRVGDGWTSENISWKVSDTKTSQVDRGMTVQSDVRWLGVIDDQKQPIVDENIRITVYKREDQFRIIDYDFTLSPLKDSVHIGGSEDEKGYGGFSFRLKLPANVAFTGKDGTVAPAVTAVDAGPWMNVTGSFDGDSTRRSGVLVFPHPSNPGHPQSWILRRAKSMQNAVFPGRYPVMIPADGYAFRYRMVIHRNLEAGIIEKLYREYTQINDDVSD